MSMLYLRLLKVANLDLMDILVKIFFSSPLFTNTFFFFFSINYNSDHSLWSDDFRKPMTDSLNKFHDMHGQTFNFLVQKEKVGLGFKEI